MVGGIVLHQYLERNVPKVIPRPFADRITFPGLRWVDVFLEELSFIPERKAQVSIV